MYMSIWKTILDSDLTNASKRTTNSLSSILCIGQPTDVPWSVIVSSPTRYDLNLTQYIDEGPH